MKLFTYDAPCIIHKFSRHDELRDIILRCIEDDAPNFQYRLKNNSSDIQTDYGSTYGSSSYWEILEGPLYDYMAEICDFMGYDHAEIDSIWYQQYYYGGKHGWHVHQSCTFTSVYYVEYPDGSPPTEFMNLMTKELIQIDSIEEGDILTFPSYIVHRASENKSDHRKTILSWHNNVRYSVIQ
jgi:hypothetical protein